MCVCVTEFELSENIICIGGSSGTEAVCAHRSRVDSYCPYFSGVSGSVGARQPLSVALCDSTISVILVCLSPVMFPDVGKVLVKF